MRHRIRGKRIGPYVETALAAHDLRISRHNAGRHDAIDPRRQIEVSGRRPADDVAQFQHEGGNSNRYFLGRDLRYSRWTGTSIPCLVQLTGMSYEQAFAESQQSPYQPA